MICYRYNMIRYDTIWKWQFSKSTNLNLISTSFFYENLNENGHK